MTTHAGNAGTRWLTSWLERHEAGLKRERERERERERGTENRGREQK